MKLIELFKPGIITTLDSYRRHVYSHNNYIRLMQLNNENSLNQMQTQMWNYIIVEAEANKFKSINASIEELDSKIKYIENQLNNKNNSYQYNEYLNSELDKLTKLKNDVFKDLSDTIDKLDLSHYFNDLIQNIQDFVVNLSSDQLVALFNLTCIYMLISTLISIGFLFFGEFLIDYFKIDSNYPKIAKFILLKKRLNKHYLIFYIIIIIIIFTVIITGNLYMFFLKYFV